MKPGDAASVDVDARDTMDRVEADANVQRLAFDVSRDLR